MLLNSVTNSTWANLLNLLAEYFQFIPETVRDVILASRNKLWLVFTFMLFELERRDRSRRYYHCQSMGLLIHHNHLPHVERTCNEDAFTPPPPQTTSPPPLHTTHPSLTHVITQFPNSLCRTNVLLSVLLSVKEPARARVSSAFWN